ncbi:hypothetical protein N656DRAFT_845456 [Canariomyces notabilis]|uniref:Uncharacterized protein n=1 Tax=Canariomyces notabilis TaxID=2074819 RepID=A0AAN6YRD4_9PEZI|nr:hypothetical protein N656DRAFT_845456 [Canariomyces arenarius]
MRQSLTSALLLLAAQVPSLTHGLPIPLHGIGDGTQESQSLISLTPLTPEEGESSLVVQSQTTNHPITDNIPQLAPSDDDVVGDEGSIKEDTVTVFAVETELAELETLRHQLASLEREICARERWLARVLVGSDTPRGGILDCDGVRCVAQCLLRKVGYAVAAIFDRDDGDEEVHHRLPSTNRTRPFPLPPWRSPLGANDTRDGSEGEWIHPGVASEPIHLSNPLVPVVFLLILVFPLLRLFVSRIGRRNGPSAMAAPPRWLPVVGRDQRPRRQWRFWARRRRGCGDAQGREFGGEGCRVTAGGLETEDHEDYGYTDEKEVFIREEAELIDEKDARLFEDQFQEGTEGEHDHDDEVRDGYGEPLTLSEEIASFRALADLVSDIVAAEGERSRARQIP